MLPTRSLILDLPCIQRYQPNRDGFPLLVLGPIPTLGILLAIRLGIVFALFTTIRYNKFMRGSYLFSRPSEVRG